MHLYFLSITPAVRVTTKGSPKRVLHSVRDLAIGDLVKRSASFKKAWSVWDCIRFE